MEYANLGLLFAMIFSVFAAIFAGLIFLASTPFTIFLKTLGIAGIKLCALTEAIKCCK